MSIKRRSSSEPTAIQSEGNCARIPPYEQLDFIDFLAYYDSLGRFEDACGKELEKLLQSEDEDDEQATQVKNRLQNFYFPVVNIKDAFYENSRKDVRLKFVMSNFRDLEENYKTESVERGLPENYWFQHCRKILMQFALSIIFKSLKMKEDVILPVNPDDIVLPARFDASKLRADLTSFLRSNDGCYMGVNSTKKRPEYQQDLNEMCSIFNDGGSSSRSSNSINRGVDVGRICQLFKDHDIYEFRDEMVDFYNKVEDLMLPVPVRIGKYVNRRLVSRESASLQEGNWDEDMRLSRGPYRNSSASSVAAASASVHSATPAASAAASAAESASAKLAKKTLASKTAAAAIAAAAVSASTAVGAVGSAVNRIKSKYDRMDPLIPAMGGGISSVQAHAPLQKIAKPIKKRPHQSPQAALDVASDSDSSSDSSKEESKAASLRRAAAAAVARRHKHQLVEEIEEEDGDVDDHTGADNGNSVRLLKGTAARSTAVNGAASYPARLSASPAGRKQPLKSNSGDDGDDDFKDGNSAAVTVKRRASESVKGPPTKRVRWTEEESECLKQAVRIVSGESGSATLWRDILNHEDYREIFAGRTNVNLKDKYRNILRDEERKQQREAYLQHND